MKYILNIIIGLITLVFFSNPGAAQTENTGVTQMVVSAQTQQGTINITWYPVDATAWGKLSDIGYTIERQELNNDGNPIGLKKQLASRIIPQKNEWFLEYAGEEGGELLEPIRALMYDEDFAFESGPELNETAMKFNYIAYEAAKDPNIAFAVGLGFADSDVEAEKYYRYTVKADDNSINGSVDILAYLNEYERNPRQSPFEFSFPTGQSLSEMYIQNRTDQDLKLISVARAYGDSIVIKWAPPTTQMWERTQQSGFEIYRSKNDEDPVLIATVKQRPESQINPEALIAKDSMAFLAAGILYGSYDDAGVETPRDRMAMIDNAFTTAMLTSERSALAADILGFRFVDKEVEQNQEYIYIISTPNKRNNEVSMVDLINTYQPLEGPGGAYLTEGDGAIGVKWSRELNANKYSYYKIERSSNGKNYEQINDAPLIFMDSDVAEIPEYEYIDNVPATGQKYNYRLYGGNSFGEWSLPVELEGQARDLTPPTAAFNNTAEYLDTIEQFYVSWNQAVMPADFEYTQVIMSDDDIDYSAVSEKLGSDVTDFSMSINGLNMEGNYFFKIAHYDKLGNVSYSNRSTALVPDMTPPFVPQDMEGTIDSLGTVEVSWSPSESKDIKGYWLYWANNPGDEMSIVSPDLITGTSHTWTIEKVSLTEKIYLTLRAQDNSFNRSEASPIIEIERPDYIAPVPPRPDVVLVESSRLTPIWKESTNEDLEYYLLYRRGITTTDSTWVLKDSIPKEMTFYDDYDVQIGTTYEYAVKAVDDWGNTSDFSNIMQAKMMFSKEGNVANGLNVEQIESKKIKLTWTYSPSELVDESIPHTFDIYRSTGTGGLTLLTKVDHAQFVFTDSDLHENVLYTYAIRVRYENGWVGDMSETKSIMVQ